MNNYNILILFLCFGLFSPIGVLAAQKCQRGVGLHVVSESGPRSLLGQCWDANCEFFQYSLVQYSDGQCEKISQIKYYGPFKTHISREEFMDSYRSLSKDPQNPSIDYLYFTKAEIDFIFASSDLENRPNVILLPFTLLADFIALPIRAIQNLNRSQLHQIKFALNHLARLSDVENDGKAQWLSPRKFEKVVELLNILDRYPRYQ